jgi:hypothetical protein
MYRRITDRRTAFWRQANLTFDTLSRIAARLRQRRDLVGQRSGVGRVAGRSQNVVDQHAQELLEVIALGLRNNHQALGVDRFRMSDC